MSLFLSGSKEVLVLLDVCEFSSSGLTPFSLGVLSVEPHVSVVEEVVLPQAVSLSAGGLSVEDCPDPADLLEELRDVRGQGIELLFDSPCLPGDNAFERETPDVLVFNVVFPLLSLSSIFVLVGIL